MAVFPQWRRNLFAVTAVTFVGFTGFTLVMPFLSLYVQQLGVTDVGTVALWTGLSLGITPAITSVCLPLWGRVADRFGNKILVQRSLASFVVVMAASAFVTKPWHLFALRAIQGFVAGYGALTLSMAAQSAPRDRVAETIGMVQTAQRIGPAIGPVIGGALAPLVGLRRSFLIAAVVYGLAFVIVTVLYHEPPRAPGTVAPGRQRMPFRDILALDNFVLLMIAIFGLELVDRSFGPVLPLYLAGAGYSATQVPIVTGVLFSTLAVAGALGHSLAAALLRRLPARVVIAAATVVGAIALALFAEASALWLLVLAMAGIGIGLGSAATASYAAANAVIPPQAHGASFGFLTSAALIGSAVSPVIAGVISGSSIRVVFVAGVAVLAVLAAGVARLMRNRAVNLDGPAAELETKDTDFA